MFNPTWVPCWVRVMNVHVRDTGHLVITKEIKNANKSVPLPSQVNNHNVSTKSEMSFSSEQKCLLYFLLSLFSSNLN
jgi:hypothetical protein